MSKLTKKKQVLQDNYGEVIKCSNCYKEIVESDEIEYSREHCEHYCCPDCASNKYFENEGSTPLSFEDAQKHIKKDIYGWNV